MADIVGDMPGKNALVGTLSSQKNLVGVVSQLSGGYERGYEEGEKAGYNTGYEIGVTEGAEVGYAKGEQEGYNKGVAEVEAKTLWTKYITGGNYLFHKAKFPENAEVVLEYHDICSNLDCLMRAAENVKKFTLICENPNPTYGTVSMPHLCSIVSTLEYVDLSRFKPRIYNLTSAFSSNPKLKEVAGEIDYSLCTHLTNTFQGDTALEKISVTPGSIKVNFYINASPNLTAETIQSIIDGLADLTGTTTQTLSLHKTVGGKLTPEQKADITAKNWTLVY